MSADSLTAVIESLEAQCTWLLALAQANEKKNPKVVSDLRAVVQNTRIDMGRVAKIFAARTAADGVAIKTANDAADAAQKALDDLKGTFPPAADVLDADDKAVLAAEADALGRDVNTGDPK